MHTNAFASGFTFFRRKVAALFTVVAVVTGLLAITASAASATSITPTGLTRLTFASGSFLTVNTGLSTQQNFDLGPTTSVGCNDLVENNDQAPLGTVGSGGGTDALFDFYPTNGSRDLASGTATGGSTTTVVDSTQTWTSNQFAGKSVWLTAGPGSAATAPGAHIVSNTATTLTLSANGGSTPNGVAGFTTAAGAGSVYHVSTADPECTAATDDSETAAGLQPKENVVIVATVNADGSTSIPKTVRTSEAQAVSLGGIYFPPAYIPDSTLGVIQAGIQPAPTAAPATPFPGTINIDTGAVSMPINIRIQLQGGSGLTALGTNCYVPSSADSNGIPLNLQTGTTDPPAPNAPISGVPFNTHNGRFTAVDNSFAVGGAGSNCALLNLGASSINTAFGLPAAAGSNTASFVLQTSPPLNYSGPADAGPDQFVHTGSTVTLDGSQSYNVASDPIATYSWVQTDGPTVALTGADTAHPTFTSDPSDASYTFALTVTTTGAATSTDSVTVANSANVAPVANAGPDVSGVVAGTVVTLKGSASDANHDPLTYNWTQTAGPTVTLSDPHALRPTFTVPAADAPAGDSYSFDLTASDAFSGSSTDSVTVAEIASTPTVTVAKARSGGTCSNFCTGDVVTLTANITNPDGTAPADYTYAWSQTGGRITPLSSTTVEHPTYSLPSSGVNPTTAACTSGGALTTPTAGSANCPTYSVVVTKTNTAKSSAQANLAVYASTLPTRPVANAGAAFTRGPSKPATLTGTASTQANGHTISYAWTQTAGDPVTLSDPTVASPTFTTPATQQTLTFSLVVTDTQSPITGSGTNGKTSLASTVNVTVSSDNVIADAGPDQSGKVAGNVVTLSAAASSDPNGLPLSYTWQQLSGPAVTLSNPNAVSPTFTVPPVDNPIGATFTFTVTATNGGANPTDTDTDASPVTITSIPSTPTVAAPTKARSGGTCTNFCIGDLVTLSVAITNADGNAAADYSYAWVQTGGRTTALSDATAAHPTYILPPSGVAPGNAAVCTSGTTAVSPTNANCPTYKVTVTKTNTNKTSAQSATLAGYGSTLPARPVANAGVDQIVSVTDPVTLAGVGTQTNGHPVSYAWTQTGGATVTLSDPTVAAPTFTAPASAGALTFSLVVTDTQSGIVGSGTNGNTSLADPVTITVQAAAPVANAGSDQDVRTSRLVTLHGSGTQADNDALSYAWSQTAGTPVTLSDATAAEPTFTSPASADTLSFSLTVTDTVTSIASVPDSVTITVTVPAAPVADAGADQHVDASTAVTLHGSGTQADDDPLTYAWTQTDGASVTLSDDTVAEPTFTAPPTAGDLTFSLVVTDSVSGISSVADSVTVTVSLPGRPVANAGADQQVNITRPVTLHGSGTQDDGHILSYAWSQTGGPAVTLSDASVAEPTFTAPASPAVLTFSLVVTDTESTVPGNNTSFPDSMTVSVTLPNISGVVTNVGSVPVSGASVLAYAPADGFSPTAVATTAADGSYALTLAPGTYDLLVVGPAGSDFISQWYSGASARSSATHVPLPVTNAANVDVHLVLGGSIAGTVTDAALHPAAGVTVSAYLPANTFTAAVATTTAANGTYVLHAVPAGSINVLFTPTPASALVGQWYNAAPNRPAATAVVLNSGGSATGINARLAAGGSITGVVTVQGGGAAAGVTVQAFGSADTFVPSGTAVTAANGSYTITGLSIGDYNVRFLPTTGSGLGTEWYSGAASRTTATVVHVVVTPTVHANAALKASATISGKVTDSHGPVAGFTVRAYTSTDTFGPSLTAVTAADGTYSIVTHAPDTYKVLFQGPGYVTQWWSGAANRAAGTAINTTPGSSAPNVNATMVPSP